MMNLWRPGTVSKFTHMGRAHGSQLAAQGLRCVAAIPQHSTTAQDQQQKPVTIGELTAWLPPLPNDWGHGIHRRQAGAAA